MMENNIEKSFPFDAQDVNGKYDRVYTADDFARYFRSFISSGLFMEENTSLQVLANNDMTVTLHPGKMMIDGYRYDAEGEIIIPISPADGLLDRIDRIAITWSRADRDIHCTIQEGEFSYEPTAPVCRRSAEYKDYVVADIYVAANSISIKQSAITDQRLNSEVCGLAAPFMEFDTTLIFNQLQAFYKETILENELWTNEEKAKFESLLELIKGLLDGEAASHLQMQLDELNRELSEQKKNIQNMVTDAFSVEADYSAGDYCIYNNTLYQFTTDKPAGVWDPEVVKKTTIADQLSKLDVQSKLECRSNLLLDIGKTVRVTNEAQMWEKIFDEELSVVFTLPGTNKYTVALIGDGEQPEYEEDILLGYGEYKVMKLEYNKSTFQGIQSLLNAHKENELEVGDEIPLTLEDGTEMVYQVGGVDIYDDHDVVFVPKWLYPKAMPMDSRTVSFYGGWNATYLNAWLNNDLFDNFPDEVKNLMVNTTQYTAVNFGYDDVQKTEGKIFLPTAWEVFGSDSGASPKEHTYSNSRQWPIFAVSSNRIKKLGKDGDFIHYWTSSSLYHDRALYMYAVIVNMGGLVGSLPTNSTIGVLPCFRLKAQEG